MTDHTHKTDPSKCPVCGAFKFAHQEYCTDCTEHDRRMMEAERWRKRRRAFGDLWWTR